MSRRPPARRGGGGPVWRGGGPACGSAAGATAGGDTRGSGRRWPGRPRFELYDSPTAAEAASDGPQLTYVTYFPGPVKGLTPGLAVTMKGVQVGRVRDVRLRYVPQNATLETPVTFGIDPRKLELP